MPRLLMKRLGFGLRKELFHAAGPTIQQLSQASSLRQSNHGVEAPAKSDEMTALLLYSGTFSRAEQRVLRTIFAAMTDDGGKCAAPLATLARESNASRSTVRNAIARAVAVGLFEKTERRSRFAVSLPNVLTILENERITDVAR
jgi:hypothetical protein